MAIQVWSKRGNLQPWWVFFPLPDLPKKIATMWCAMMRLQNYHPYNPYMDPMGKFISVIGSLTTLDIITWIRMATMLGNSCKHILPGPKWWFDGDSPWYKVKNHLKHIQNYNLKCNPQEILKQFNAWWFNPIEHISQIGSFRQIGMNIKHLWVAT